MSAVPSTRSTARGRRRIACPAAALALLAGSVAAHASVASRETADQILAQAGTGATAPQILKASFPAASLRAAADVPVRVLVADLAPRITVAAHGHPVLRARGRRIALVADHRYVVSHARSGWRVRDLDGPRTIRRIRGSGAALRRRLTVGHRPSRRPARAALPRGPRATDRRAPNDLGHQRGAPRALDRRRDRRGHPLELERVADGARSRRDPHAIARARGPASEVPGLGPHLGRARLPRTSTESSPR